MAVGANINMGVPSGILHRAEQIHILWAIPVRRRGRTGANWLSRRRRARRARRLGRRRRRLLARGRGRNRARPEVPRRRRGRRRRLRGLLGQRPRARPSRWHERRRLRGLLGGQRPSARPLQASGGASVSSAVSRQSGRGSRARVWIGARASAPSRGRLNASDGSIGDCGLGLGSPRVLTPGGEDASGVAGRSWSTAASAPSKDGLLDILVLL